MRKALAMLAAMILSLPGCGGDEGEGVNATSTPVGSMLSQIKFPDPSSATPPSSASLSFVSPEGDFGVDMPGEPRSSVQDFQDQGRKRRVHSYTFEDADHSTFQLSYSEFTSGFYDRRGQLELLQQAIAGYRARPGWTVEGTTPAKVGDNPGYEIRLAVRSADGKEGDGLARIYAINNRLFQIVVVGLPSKLPADRMRHFVESFAPIPPSTSWEGASFTSFRWVDEASDVLSREGRDVSRPDGRNDQHLALLFDLPAGTTIEGLSVAGFGLNGGFTQRVVLQQGGKPLGPVPGGGLGEFSGKQAIDAYMDSEHVGDPGSKFEATAIVRVGGKAHRLRAEAKRPGGPTRPEAATLPTLDPEATPPPSSAGGASVTGFAWSDAKDDRVGGHFDPGKPDGKEDQHFTLGLKLPADAVIEAITIFVDNHNRWVTRPTPGKWPV